MPWEYTLDSGRTKEVIIPDMGHGNCLGIFEEKTRPFLIDCGTSDQSKGVNLKNHVKPRLDGTVRRDLAITHYHFDHYNLLDRFPYRYFHNVHVPALPRRSSTASVMLGFLSLSIVVRHKGYPLIRMITSRGSHTSPYTKGDSFTALGRDWEVLWPDYRIIDERNRRRITRIRTRIDEIIEELNEDQQREFDKWYSLLGRSLSGEPEKAEMHNEITEEIRGDPKVQESLESIEGHFRTLANRSSLVIEDALTEFLFTGDIDRTILDRFLNFGSNHYLVVQAAHHGGYYGQAFNNLSTEFLVISRNWRDKPRCEYFRDISWTNLVDTARTGNCIIRC